MVSFGDLRYNGSRPQPQGGTFLKPLDFAPHPRTPGAPQFTDHPPQAPAAATDCIQAARLHGGEGGCAAVSDILSRVGDKWSVLVVAYLGGGPMRFNELKRGIGNISQKMLTSTLRGLERDGFVSRTVTPTRPPQVEYALTDLGRCLLVPVSALADWAAGNIDRIHAARAAYDASQPAPAGK